MGCRSTPTRQATAYLAATFSASAATSCLSRSGARTSAVEPNEKTQPASHSSE